MWSKTSFAQLLGLFLVRLWIDNRAIFAGFILVFLSWKSTFYEGNLRIIYSVDNLMTLRRFFHDSFFLTLFGNWFSSLSILNLTLNEISPFLPPCLLILKWIWSGCLRNSLEALAALSYSAAPSFRNRQINHFDNETRGITQAFFDNIEFSPHNRLLSVELCHFVAPATLWRCQKKPRNFDTKKKFNQNQQTVVQGRSVYF